jgi:hypothetical protein
VSTIREGSRVELRGVLLSLFLHWRVSNRTNLFYTGNLESPEHATP